MEIQTADSIAASLVVTTWASLWTTTRSTSRSTTTRAAKAAHTQPGVENETKSVEADSAAASSESMRRLTPSARP